MPRFTGASVVLTLLVTLPSCSLLIDTNADGVIPKKNRGGQAGEDAGGGGKSANGGSNGGNVINAAGAGGTLVPNTTSGGGGVAAGAGANIFAGASGAHPVGGAPMGGTAGTFAVVGGSPIAGSGGISPASGGGSSGANAGGKAAAGNPTIGGTTSTSGAAGAGAGLGTAGAPVCTGAAVSCSGTCVDTKTSTANCGACGHNCRGGECASGQCRPMELASVTDTTGPMLLGQNENALYYRVWAGGYSYAIGRVLKGVVLQQATELLPGSSSGATIVDGKTYIVGYPCQFGMASEPYQVDVCSSIDCFGRTVWKQSSTVKPISSNSSTPRHLSTFDLKCYSLSTFCVEWWNDDGTRLAGSTFLYNGPSDNTVEANFLANGDRVFWRLFVRGPAGAALPGSLYTASSDDTAVGQLAGNVASSLVLIDANAKSVIFNESGTWGLYRVPLPLGLGSFAPVPVGVSGVGATEDETWFYWMNDQGTLSRCLPDNCVATAKVLAVGSPGGALYQDSVALYWARSNPPSLMQLAK